MNTKLPAVTDAHGHPIRFLIWAGPISDGTGAAPLVSLPQADGFLADRGYEADRLREALEDEGASACIPGRKSRQKTAKHDRRRDKGRNRIEIMSGRLNDGRRVATCSGRGRTSTDRMPVEPCEKAGACDFADAAMHSQFGDRRMDMGDERSAAYWGSLLAVS